MPLAQLRPREQDRFAGYVLLEQGLNRAHVAAMVGVSGGTVRAWEQRFAAGGEIRDAPRRGRRRTYDKDIEARFIAFYCQTTPLPDCGQGRWSLRTAEDALKHDAAVVGASLSRSTMQRMLSREALKPHRVRYFLQITDPDFFPKMEHLIGLYHSQTPYLFCFDECPGIQVLQRLAPDSRPGDADAAQCWLSEFDYLRHGTLDVFAFLEVSSGRVQAECHGDHAGATFLDVFARHVSGLPSHVPLHYVMDNLDTHCSLAFCRLVAALSGSACPTEKALASRLQRRQWLGAADKRIVIHFTPFHGSWLNLVEIWFRIMGRMCLKGSYGHPDQLRDAIVEFGARWSDDWAHPFRWTYDGTGLHRKAVLRFVGMLTRSPSALTLQLLTKESLLMVNMMRHYWEQVDAEHWLKLFGATHHATELLRQKIHQSTQPLVKKRADEALSRLLAAIQQNTARATVAAA